MEKRISIDDYFKMPETNRPEELIYGVVREPPAPTYGRQRKVVRLTTLLDMHVRAHGLGEICVSPVSVVFDRELELVVEPDIIFISHERLAIALDRVWGAPDLIIEVASPGTEHYDRTLTLARYRKHGVRECWFVHPRDFRVDVIDCATEITESFSGDAPIRSRVLPAFSVSASECFK